MPLPPPKTNFYSNANAFSVKHWGMNYAYAISPHKTGRLPSIGLTPMIETFDLPPRINATSDLALAPITFFYPLAYIG